MDIDFANAPIPDGQRILGLMARNNGCSCARHHCCLQINSKGWLYMVFFSFCIVLDKIHQELEVAIEVTMDCDLHPEGQRCRVGYLARRIAHNKVEAAQYVNRIAVVIELLQDSKEQTKQRICEASMELLFLHFIIILLCS